MKQAHDAKQSSSLITCTVQIRVACRKQLVHPCCSDFDKPCLYYPLIHPPRDYVLSNQIVISVLVIYEYYIRMVYRIYYDL